MVRLIHLKRYRMMRCFAASMGLLCAALLLPASVQPPPAPNGAIAIVVHPSVPVDNLAFSQLRRIFLGEQQFWPNHERITLLMRAPDAYERDIVLKQIYEMSEGQFRQYWIAKIFRSEVTSGPKIVYSTEMAYDLVTTLPGSITFIRSEDVRPDAKVLRIDGRLPAESAYPLK